MGYTVPIATGADEREHNMRKVTFITINGKVISEDEEDSRKASAYVARNTKAAARGTGTGRTYATVTYLISEKTA